MTSLVILAISVLIVTVLFAGLVLELPLVNDPVTGDPLFLPPNALAALVTSRLHGCRLLASVYLSDDQPGPGAWRTVLRAIDTTSSTRRISCLWQHRARERPGASGDHRDPALGLGPRTAAELERAAAGAVASIVALLLRCAASTPDVGCQEAVLANTCQDRDGL